MSGNVIPFIRLPSSFSSPVLARSFLVWLPNLTQGKVDNSLTWVQCPLTLWLYDLGNYLLPLNSLF